MNEPHEYVYLNAECLPVYPNTCRSVFQISTPGLTLSKPLSPLSGMLGKRWIYPDYAFPFLIRNIQCHLPAYPPPRK